MFVDLVVSTIVYFVAAFFIRRYLDEVGIPKGVVRSLTIFCFAAAISYGVAALIDWIFP